MRGTGPVEAETARPQDDPLVFDFVRPLPDLLGPDGPTSDSSIERLAARLGPAKQQAVLRLSLGTAERSKPMTLLWSNEGARLSGSGGEEPDLELIMTLETWGDIASGKVSPLEAFGRGRMRVRGDVNLARRVVRALHDLAPEE